jgi:hypothetical protein
MREILGTVFLVCIFNSVFAEDTVSVASAAASAPVDAQTGIKIGGLYRLMVTTYGFTLDDKQFYAPKNSKLVVIDVSTNYYLVRFDRIRNSTHSDEESASNRTPKESIANTGLIYKIDKSMKVDGAASVDLDKLISHSDSGLSSGPLVVPFKYRLDDKSLDGDAEIGYYAGAKFEPFCSRGVNWCFRLVPMISAGISQVGVESETDTKSKSAFTISAGFLIDGWDGMNIGLVWGQDRVGDKTWQHEGKSWISFMIGWNLSK